MFTRDVVLIRNVIKLICLSIAADKVQSDGGMDVLSMANVCRVCASRS